MDHPPQKPGLRPPPIPWNAWGHRYWNCPRSKPKRFFPILCWKRLSILWPIPTGLPGTSPTGVDLFFDALLQAGRDGRALSHLRFGVIGPATRDTLSKRGFLADVIPSRFYAEDLGYALARAMQPGERLLLPRAKEGSPLLTQILEQAGISFCEVPLYETLCPSSRPSALLPGDLAVFTSVSTVKGFVQLLQGEEFRHNPRGMHRGTDRRRSAPAGIPRTGGRQADHRKA